MAEVRADQVPRFVWKMGDIEISQCIGCRHKGLGNICDAFPAKIPDKILVNKHDHRKPYKGDGGIRFELADR